jgi:DNA primase
VGKEEHSRDPHRCRARGGNLESRQSALPTVEAQNGIEGEHFYQKRAPANRPPWIEIVELRFPSGRAAEEIVPRDAASLAWLANLACLELHPHPVRAGDLDRFWLRDHAI